MLNSLNNAIKRHLAYNILSYLIMTVLFILGITIGAVAVNNISEIVRTDTRIYLEGFFSLTSRGELQPAYILKQSIKFNLYFALAVFFSGLIYPGVIFIPALTIFRGFCIGFSVAFLAQNFGRGGFLMSIGSILPQNIIYVPVIIIMGVIGLNYSLRILKNRYSQKRCEISGLYTSYAFSGLILFILLIAGSIIEAYITSFIIRALVPYVS